MEGCIPLLRRIRLSKKPLEEEAPALIARGNTLVAAVAEVEVDRSSGVVAVKRVTIGHDCGLIINPDGLRFQIEANAIQGVSRALFEEVKFDASGVQTVDWITYPVITFRECAGR